MKADLHSSQVRMAGVGGLAHRTAAGFVVLTSADSDGDDMLELIDASQHQSDLIDRVVESAQTDGPEAFAMLFTAGSELYLIVSGSAAASIQSDTAHVTLRATPDHVLVHPVGAGINETSANVWLHLGALERSTPAGDDLVAGTADAGSVEIAVGDATLGAVVIEAGVLATTPATSTPAPANEAESSSESAPAADPVQAADGDEPELVAIIPTIEAPPAAQEIKFADDPVAPVVEEPVNNDATAQHQATDKPAVDVEPVAIDPEATPEPVALGGEPAAEPIADQVAPPAPVVVAPTSEAGSVMVLGVACSQGHHNHPDAVYCSQCGTKMGVHHTTVLLNGPRPPLGVLVVDDGSTYSLSEDLVIGREPTSHEAVVKGAASPMILTDDTLSLSRKHARIVLDDWSVFVQDLSSSNGTFLSRAGATDAWAQVESGSTTALEPGDRLRVGGRIIQVELHHVR